MGGNVKKFMLSLIVTNSPLMGGVTDVMPSLIGKFFSKHTYGIKTGLDGFITTI